MLLEQFHHTREIEYGTADPVQLIHDYLADQTFFNITYQLLKLRPVRILAAVSFVGILLKSPPFNSYLQNSIWRWMEMLSFLSTDCLA